MEYNAHNSLIIVIGQESTVWFDEKDVNKDSGECRPSIKEAHKVVEHLIAEERKEGIVPEKIIIGETDLNHLKSR